MSFLLESTVAVSGSLMAGIFIVLAVHRIFGMIANKTGTENSKYTSGNRIDLDVETVSSTIADTDTVKEKEKSAEKATVEPNKKPVVLHVHGAMRSLSKEARLDPSQIRDPRIEREGSSRGDANWYVPRDAKKEDVTQREYENRKEGNITQQTNETEKNVLKNVSKGTFKSVDVNNTDAGFSIAKHAVKDAAKNFSKSDGNGSLSWRTLLCLSVAAVVVIHGLLLSLGYLLQLGKQPELSLLDYFRHVMAQWDSSLYLKIADNGYSMEDMSLFALFPLFPALVSGIDFIFHDTVVTSFVLANIFSAISLALLYRLMALDKGGEYPIIGALFLLFSPMAFFHMLPYSESLFIMLSIASIYLVRKKKYLMACLIGGFSAATRLLGILIFIPILTEMIINIQSGLHKSNPKNRDNALKYLYLLIIPVGLLSHLYLCYHYIGEKFGFFEILRVYWYQSLGNPVNTFRYMADYLMNFSQDIGQFLIWLLQLVFIFITLVILCLAAKRIRLSYLLYAVAFMCFILSSGWLTIGPRLVFSMFVFYIAEAELFRSTASRTFTLAASAQLLIGCYLLFYNGIGLL